MVTLPCFDAGGSCACGVHQQWRESWSTARFHDLAPFALRREWAL